MNQNRRTKRRLAAGAAAGVVAGALWTSAAANAAPVTFAQYEEASGAINANLFDYTDATLGGNAQLTAVSVPVTFSYESLAGLPADLQGPQFATLTLTTSTAQTVGTLFGALNGEDFNVQGNDTLTITRNAPALESPNLHPVLLQMNFTGELMASLGGFTAVLSGDSTGTTPLPLGAQITYSSDFMSFTSVTSEDYSLNFTSWTTTADSNGVELDSTSHLFNTATAASTGSFDAGSGIVVTAVPEPATTLLAAAGIGIVFLRRRRSQV